MFKAWRQGSRFNRAARLYIRSERRLKAVPPRDVPYSTKAQALDYIRRYPSDYTNMNRHMDLASAVSIEAAHKNKYKGMRYRSEAGRKKMIGEYRGALTDLMHGGFGIHPLLTTRGTKVSRFRKMNIMNNYPMSRAELIELASDLNKRKKEKTHKLRDAALYTIGGVGAASLGVAGYKAAKGYKNLIGKRKGERVFGSLKEFRNLPVNRKRIAESVYAERRRKRAISRRYSRAAPTHGYMAEKGRITRLMREKKYPAIIPTVREATKAERVAHWIRQNPRKAMAMGLGGAGLVGAGMITARRRKNRHEAAEGGLTGGGFAESNCGTYKNMRRGNLNKAIGGMTGLAARGLVRTRKIMRGVGGFAQRRPLATAAIGAAGLTGAYMAGKSRSNNGNTVIHNALRTLDIAKGSLSGKRALRVQRALARKEQGRASEFSSINHAMGNKFKSPIDASQTPESRAHTAHRAKRSAVSSFRQNRKAGGNPMAATNAKNAQQVSRAAQAGATKGPGLTHGSTMQHLGAHARRAGRWIRNNPIKSGAIGAGALYAGHKLFGRKKQEAY